MFLDPLISLAQKAIELDPDYADAYAWAGIWTLYSGVYAGTKEITTAAWEATPYIEKALKLDVNCSVAHLGQGNIYEWLEWDFIKAEEEYQNVSDLGPNNPVNYDFMAEFFLKMNRPDKAHLWIRSIDRSYSMHAKVSFLKGNMIEATMSINSIAEAVWNSDYWINYSLVGEAYIWIEEFDSARVFLESAMANDTFYIMIPRNQACLALAYYKTGDFEQAKSVIDHLIHKSKTTSAGSPSYYTGWYFSWIGELDSAFNWLERAYNVRSPEFPYFKIDPAFNSLKDDPRYWDLYERTGHKAYDEYVEAKAN